MQNILPDLKICQEEKGIIKESKFSFVKFPSGEICIMETNLHIAFNLCPAPLTDEILKVLPQQFGGSDLEIVKLPHDIYSCGYPRDIMGRGINYVQDKKLSNALFLLAIKLVDEGIIKLWN